MASAQVCPVVGTTNTVLPPQHPEFNPDVPGQVCPVTNATTDHHHTLQKHPKVPGASNDASACPVLKNVVDKDPVAKATDEKVCPVVGTATTVLPPQHPDMKDSKDGDICPVTKATLGHHAGKVHTHPKVAEGTEAKCPVVGAQA